MIWISRTDGKFCANLAEAAQRGAFSWVSGIIFALYVGALQQPQIDYRLTRRDTQAHQVFSFRRLNAQLKLQT